MIAISPSPFRGADKLSREQREPLLLDAAVAEFATSGYGGASLSAIAGRAGVSKSLLLAYFGSKDGLYGACVERAATNVAERVERVINNDCNPQEMATAVLGAFFDALEARPEDWAVINDRTAPRGAPGAEVAHEHRRVIASQAAKGIAALGNFREFDADDLNITTRVWMNTVTAVVDWWMRHPDRTADEMTARCARLIKTITTCGDLRR